MLINSRKTMVAGSTGANSSIPTLTRLGMLARSWHRTLLIGEQEPKGLDTLLSCVHAGKCNVARQGEFNSLVTEARINTSGFATTPFPPTTPDLPVHPRQSPYLSSLEQL